MRISDWSSDGCSSDLRDLLLEPAEDGLQVGLVEVVALVLEPVDEVLARRLRSVALVGHVVDVQALLEPVERLLGEGDDRAAVDRFEEDFRLLRSEEHTSELQSLMRISYAVFCLNKKKHQKLKNK